MTPLTLPTESLTPPREVSGSLTAQKGRMFLARLPPNQALPARSPEAPTSGSGSCMPQCPAGNLAVTSDASLWSTPTSPHPCRLSQTCPSVCLHASPSSRYHHLVPRRPPDSPVWTLNSILAPSNPLSTQNLLRATHTLPPSLAFPAALIAGGWTSVSPGGHRA